MFDHPVILCDKQLSSSTLEALFKGPEFSPGLPSSRFDQLTSVHRVALFIPEKGWSEFLITAVCPICHNVHLKTGKFPILNSVEELCLGKLKWLKSDKTGDCVLFDEGTYEEKVTKALEICMINQRKHHQELCVPKQRFRALMNLPPPPKTHGSFVEPFFLFLQRRH